MLADGKSRLSRRLLSLTRQGSAAASQFTRIAYAAGGAALAPGAIDRVTGQRYSGEWA